MQKVGVFLSRFQPVHNGHLYLIDKIRSENDKILILIGSKNKSYTLRNPFNFDLRYKMVYNSISNKDNVKIIGLIDYNQEDAYDLQLDWGEFLYYNVVNLIEQKNFKLYSSDKIILNWFHDRFKSKINFVFVERKDEITSTKIRESILNDTEYFIKNCPEIVYQERKNLKLILEKTKDFT